MKGIYQYKDLKTDEIVYVGKDSYIDKHKRHKHHLAPSRYDEQQINRIIQNNPDRYEYSVLYSSDDASENDLNMLEISFIKRYNPRFNFTKGGDGSTGYKHTEEAKEKLRKPKSEEAKQNMSKNHADFTGENHPMYGKHHSEETKRKMSESMKGENHPNYGKSLSDKTKNKISKARNTSGYFRVYKQKNKAYKQGFTWVYMYYENGKHKSINSVSIEKLEEKVKAKGLEWLKFEKED